MTEDIDAAIERVKSAPMVLDNPFRAAVLVEDRDAIIAHIVTLEKTIPELRENGRTTGAAVLDAIDALREALTLARPWVAAWTPATPDPGTRGDAEIALVKIDAALAEGGVK